MLSFTCGRNVGANVDYTRRLCSFLHELLCCFNRVIIVVCSVYIARYGSDVTHVVLSREHVDLVGGVLCSISQGLLRLSLIFYTCLSAQHCAYFHCHDHH